jgi:hypothetical protein
MGARAQVLIKETGVYLYTHWGSGTIKEDVQNALNSPQGKNRLNDPEYLTRIIFEHLIGDERNTETGFGIGTEIHGDIDTLIVVNNGEIED